MSFAEQNIAQHSSETFLLQIESSGQHNNAIISFFSKTWRASHLLFVSHPPTSNHKYDQTQLTRLMILALQGASCLVDPLPCDKPRGVSYPKQWAQTALSFAIMQGELSTIRKLLRRYDTDINGQSPKSQSPILIALEYQQHEILRMLLKDPQLNINIQGDRGYTALHLAVIYDDPVAIEILLSHQHIDVNHLDSAGNSALLLATMAYDGLSPKRDDIIDLLLSSCKTLVNERDQRGRSVLWHAANTGNKRLICRLMQLPDLEPGISDDEGVSPLDQARKRGKNEIIALLQSLDARDGSGGISKHGIRQPGNPKFEMY
jgi:FOG: Ankyrin repeat